MPFLSEDGTRNTFVLNVNRYVGLNKHLEEAGNEQKLEDALHVMEVLSTVEGMQALNSLYSDTPLLPLKDHTVNSNGYYADIQDQINSGATAPLIYNGWENIIVAIGESMISFVTGESTLETSSAPSTAISTSSGTTRPSITRPSHRRSIPSTVPSSSASALPKPAARTWRSSR